MKAENNKYHNHNRKSKSLQQYSLNTLNSLNPHGNSTNRLKFSRIILSLLLSPQISHF